MPAISIFLRTIADHESRFRRPDDPTCHPLADSVAFALARTAGNCSLMSANFDSEKLVYPWRHSDLALDELAEEISGIVASAEKNKESRSETFERIWDAAAALQDKFPRPPFRSTSPRARPVPERALVLLSGADRGPVGSHSKVRRQHRIQRRVRLKLLVASQNDFIARQARRALRLQARLPDPQLRSRRAKTRSATRLCHRPLPRTRRSLGRPVPSPCASQIQKKPQPLRFEALRGKPLDAILALGDAPAVAASYAARGLGLPFEPSRCRRSLPQQTPHSRSFSRCRASQSENFAHVALSPAPEPSLFGIEYPCVLKPLSLSASQGVMRANYS